jgi:hypothetical protein
VSPASFSCRAISVHSKPKPDGKTFSDRPSMARMPWPDEKPGFNATCISAAG